MTMDLNYIAHFHQVLSALILKARHITLKTFMQLWEHLSIFAEIKETVVRDDRSLFQYLKVDSILKDP